MVDYIGLLGAALILLAFVLNQKGIWQDNYLRYDCVNLLGGLLLVIAAYRIGSYPFMALNAVWTLVSLKDIFSDLSDSKASRRRRGFWPKWVGK